MEIDWNEFASSEAESLWRTNPDAWFGVAMCRIPGKCVVFGNNAYSEDPRARDQAERVRSAIEERGIRVLGFGVDRGDGYSWAVAVDTEDYRELHSIFCSVDRGEFKRGPALLHV